MIDCTPDLQNSMYLSNKQYLLNANVFPYSEAYQECEVVDIQFAYNVTNLIKLDRSRQFALHARNYSVSEAIGGQGMRVRPVSFFSSSSSCT